MPDFDPTRPLPNNPGATNGPAPVPPGYVVQPGTYPAQAAPVYMAPAPQPVPQPVTREEHGQEHEHPEVILVPHSSLFYWWPVWAVGAIMFVLTWTQGRALDLDGSTVKVFPNSNLGVLFFFTIFLVILITNVEVRGLSSLVVVMAGITTAVLLAYFGKWDDILAFFGGLSVYLNQGAYFWFSLLMLLTWLLTVFVFDRMSYWVVTPGQVTRVHFWGTSSKSFDTENMVLEKRRDDLFRHWILGLGSGDLRINTYGAQAQEIYIPNLLFLGSKIHAIQHLIAEEPEAFGRAELQ